MSGQLSVCKACKKPKANFDCGICQDSVCKSCGHFLGKEAFSFLRAIPPHLCHSVYCNQCFDPLVSDVLNQYEITMDKAREVIVFTKSETKRTSHLKRKDPPYQVLDCEDEAETILRLAFFAAEDGHNCLLDLNLTQRKIIIGSHKKTVFSATAIPTTINPSEVREY
jgi:hypothetical protein